MVGLPDREACGLGSPLAHDLHGRQFLREVTAQRRDETHPIAKTRGRNPRIERSPSRSFLTVDEIDTLERVAGLYDRYFGEKSEVPLSEVAET